MPAVLKVKLIGLVCAEFESSMNSGLGSNLENEPEEVLAQEIWLSPSPNPVAPAVLPN
jgi:hypothetical protein